MFILYGAVGMVWLALWIPLVPVASDEQLKSADLDEEPLALHNVPWDRFARTPAVWAIFTAQITQGDCLTMLAFFCNSLHVRAVLCNLFKLFLKGKNKYARLLYN